jgi:general secretion pathway protein A
MENGVREMFYGSFYGLRSSPFHITPDASLLFATENHQQALGTIEYGIAAGKGFIVVTGEVGVGKTTVLRAVLDKLDPAKARIIYLFNPNVTVDDLYVSLLEGMDYSIANPSADPAKTLRALQHALLDCHKSGVDVILAVDEAQNMPETTLEHLRILSNLETAKSKLLQIILVGQPELDATLRRHSLRQLAQRVAVRARIGPLGFRQSCRYIQHRLICAGRPTEPPLFTVPALWYLAFRARGVPRNLNIYADNALINGYGHRAQRITLKVLRESIRPLQGSAHPLRRPLGWAAAAILLIAVAAEVRHIVDPAPGFTAQPAPAPAQAPAPRAPTVAIAPPPAPPTVVPDSSAAANANPAAAVAPPAVAAPTAAVAPTAVAAPTAAVAPTAAAPPPASAAATPPPPSVEVAAVPTTAPPGRRRTINTWQVRRGDSLFKVCLKTYGECAPAQLRQLFAFNPNVDSRGMIRPGDVIVLPDKAASSQPN